MKMDRIEKFGLTLFWLSILSAVLYIVGGFYSYYDYQNRVESHWNLADKSSTIEAKSMHMDNFVDALWNEQLQTTHDAIMMKTPDNNFDMNYEALKTLQQRLWEIKDMDVSSFEYQKAMEQITEQEQGDANAMLSVFQGCWYKEHYFLLWNWVCGVGIILIVICAVVGGFMRWDY